LIEQGPWDGIGTFLGHAAIAELSPVSGIKRKLDFEPAKGSFWRKAAVQIPEEEFIKRLGQIFCPWSTS
jgi:hypothetical protein